jgi:predicted ATPase
MRWGLLGPLAVWTDGGVPVRIPGAKVRALLAHLLIHAGQLISTDRLIDELWGDALPSDPAGSLQAKVSQLRRALEWAQPGARALIVHRSPGYLLQVDADTIDSGRFRTLLAQARVQSQPAAIVALLGEALAIWRGPALSDLVDYSFAQPVITQLEEQRLTALEEHIEARLALGEHGALVAELETLVAGHPLRERLRAAHMRALYLAGRQVEALDSYQQLRVQLGEQLGLDPSPKLAHLLQAILTHDPELGTRRPGAPRRTNLPAELSSLVGRTAAVVEVRKLLETGRLVTLIGPGGVGKTRLALETAAQLADGLADGAWVVELAGCDQSCGDDMLGCLVELVAAAVGVRDDATLTVPPAGRPEQLIQRLPAALQDKQLLLVLDDCERVIEAVAELADLLLRSVSELHILATSREPLGLSGELLWPVPPLDWPDPAMDGDVHSVACCSAVQLFVQRAAAARACFTLTESNTAAVAAICRRLDGLPLALELAAARVRVLPVQELAIRLDDRFRLLATGTRDAPPRQQTLRAVVDWSWELLTARERALLRRLGVFADGFTLAAAEAVCAGDGVYRSDVLDVLARLVDRSLVVVEQGSARYRLLETIAVYALERLDSSGETDQFRLRHAQWHAALAEQADRQLRGHGQRQWLERLDAESGNCRAALVWAVAQSDAPLVLRLVGALAWYWFLRGRHSEGRRLVAMALSTSSAGQGPISSRVAALAALFGLGLHDRTSTDTAERGRAALALYAGLEAFALYAGAEDPRGLAHAQWLTGFLMAGGGSSLASTRLVELALESFRQLGDQWGVAAALSIRGWEHLRRGDLAGARRDGEESWVLFAEVGDRWGQVRSADLFGVLAEIEGDYDQAHALHTEGLLLAEELGLWPVVSQQLARLGRLAMLAADCPAALVLHERALRLAREQAFEPGISFAKIGLGMIARRQGRPQAAEAQLAEVLDAHRLAGFHPGIAFIQAELGFVAELRGDQEAARARHLEGLRSAQVSGDPRAIALALEGLAGTAALVGHHHQAGWLLGAAGAARRSVDRPLPPAERSDVDRISSAVREALGETAYNAALGHGAAAGVDAVLASFET